MCRSVIVCSPPLQAAFRERTEVHIVEAGYDQICTRAGVADSTKGAEQEFWREARR